MALSEISGDERILISDKPEDPNNKVDSQLEDLFAAYARFGDEARNKGNVIAHRNVEKWLKASKLMDELHIDRHDLEDLFAKVSMRKTANYAQFKILLGKLSQQHNMDVEDMKKRLIDCGPPHAERNLIIHPTTMHSN